MKKIIINKSNLIHNLSVIKGKTKAKICAVVKANAYGHGLEIIAKQLVGKVDFFAVANIEEAMQIKAIDRESKVLILGKCDDIQRAIENDIRMSIFDEKTLINCEKIAKNMQKTAFLHLKVDSGMNRLGIKSVKEFKNCLKILRKKYLNFEGLFTHFSCSNCDENFTKFQVDNFKKYASLVGSFFSPIIHIGGSFALNYNFDFDMIRTGIFLYGYGLNNLKPVMKVESELIAVKEISAGEGVSYGKKFIADKKTRVGVIPIGYADGVPQTMQGFYVFHNGEKCRILGTICMDMIIVEVNSDAKVGDKVIVMQDAKACANYINGSYYEVLTNYCAFRGKRCLQ